MRRSAPGAVWTGSNVPGSGTSSTGHGRGLATQKRRKSNASASGSATRFACVKPGASEAVGPSHSPARIAARTSAGGCAHPRFVSSRRVLARWGTVAAYAAVAAANQLLWLTYAPITTDTAEHFGVSESAVGWLTQVFPLLYVLLAIPAGMALRPRVSPDAARRRVADRARRGRAAGRHVRARAGRPDPGRDRAAADPQRGHEGRGQLAAGERTSERHRDRVGGDLRRHRVGAAARARRWQIRSR